VTAATLTPDVRSCPIKLRDLVLAREMVIELTPMLKELAQLYDPGVLSVLSKVTDLPRHL
jgi:hypothetical protein